MAAGYWKIPKEWVQDWGLSPAEALVLSDIQDWPNCSHEERAKRVGLSTRQLTRLKDKMSSNERTKCLVSRGQNVFSLQDKMSSKMDGSTRQNVLKNRTKCPQIKKEKESSPTPPIKKNKNIEEQEEHRDESRAREEEFRQLGMVKKVDELADELREEIRNGGSFITNTMQMYGLNPQQTEEYLGWFLNHLGMGGTTLKSRGDFRRHFTNWLGIQVREQLKRQQSNGNRYQYTPGADLLNEVAEGFAAGM